MRFYPNQLFHIYNQGNNSRTIFFSDENYKYFLWKMRAYLLPYGDLISYCLMPNHFHWQFYVRKIEIPRKILRNHVDEVEFKRRVQKFGLNARVVERVNDRYANENSKITLNEAIGHVQKAYTRALNKEKNWTGSLFREKCKAKDGWIDEFITLKKLSGRTDFRFLPGNDYAYQCLIYIHENPSKAGLVTKSTDWLYSSARDYAGLRKGSFCNLELGNELIKFL